MFSQSWRSQSETQTREIADRFAAQLAAGDRVLLIGDLGAGKTVFAQGLVAHFDQDIEVTSPSYALVHAYPTTPQIFHIDLYRITDDNDLADLGFDEYLESDGIVVIEWAEKCRKHWPQRYYRVMLKMVAETERLITIEEIGDAAGG
ncbi:MAG: tRNA (adenosine(37)-N6)-threonylcarbamoyltransferase complex ATPase subunit type 1 TsaE [candidate division Zixibacteria bacterium]|nr:tRNA (adenosine(37)-N6)-threonylcarbamoyltransferase complex ATPase subunit type 1 TsaE [candidate division Zixibacteria bacterium]